MQKKLQNYLNDFLVYAMLKIILFSALCFLFSCSSSKMAELESYENILGQKIENPIKVNIGFSKNIILLPLEYLEYDIDSKFQVHIEELKENKKVKRSFDCSVQVKADKKKNSIQILGADKKNVGKKIEYSNEYLFSDISFPKGIEVEKILLYFQYCFYDLGTMAYVTEENNFHFTVEKKVDINAEIRRIYRSNKCMFEIIKTDDEIIFTQNQKKYFCSIKKIY